MTWQEVCQDKSLANLPYKIDLDGRGQIIMSPRHNKHGYCQGKIVSHFDATTQLATSSLCPDMPASLD